MCWYDVVLCVTLPSTTYSCAAVVVVFVAVVVVVDVVVVVVVVVVIFVVAVIVAIVVVVVGVVAIVAVAIVVVTFHPHCFNEDEPSVNHVAALLLLSLKSSCPKLLCY